MKTTEDVVGVRAECTKTSTFQQVSEMVAFAKWQVVTCWKVLVDMTLMKSTGVFLFFSSLPIPPPKSNKNN